MFRDNRFCLYVSPFFRVHSEKEYAEWESKNLVREEGSKVERNAACVPKSGIVNNFQAVAAPFQVFASSSRALWGP